MKFIIQAQLIVEIEADEVEKARESALDKFIAVEALGFEVKDAKVVDKKSGYFLK